MTLYAIFFCLMLPNGQQQCQPFNMTFASVEDCETTKAQMTSVQQNDRMRLVCMRSEQPVWTPAR